MRRPMSGIRLLAVSMACASPIARSRWQILPTALPILSCLGEKSVNPDHYQDGQDPGDDWTFMTGCQDDIARGCGTATDGGVLSAHAGTRYARGSYYIFFGMPMLLVATCRSAMPRCERPAIDRRLRPSAACAIAWTTSRLTEGRSSNRHAADVHPGGGSYFLLRLVVLHRHRPGCRPRPLVAALQEGRASRHAFFFRGVDLRTTFFVGLLAAAFGAARFRAARFDGPAAARSLKEIQSVLEGHFLDRHVAGARRWSLHR